MYKILVDTLVKIFNEDAYINNTISNVITNNKFTPYEKKIFTKVVYGVVENKILLDYYLQPFTSGKRVKPFMRNVLRVGAYVITFLNTANHFIVKELVDVVKKVDFNGSKFVNGVLRNYERTPVRSLDGLKQNDYLSIKYSLPLELVEYLKNDYKDNIEELLKNLCTNSETNTYRINSILTKKEDLLKEFDNNNISYSLVDDVLFTKESLIDSKYFNEGLIIPQDYSSSIPPRFLSPEKGDIVLDACSAPGSKTIQMADMMENEGKVVALDLYEHKIKLINDNAKKFGVKIINTKVADSSKITFDFMFDKILCDVPCSGLGVIGHKPDLKYRMTKEKIIEIANLSYSILENVSKYLKPQGKLVYSTCTITKIENELQIEKFLKNHPEFIKGKMELILPNATNHQDGFFICELIKK